MNCAATFFIAIISTQSLHAQIEGIETPSFLTPIATSMEEAVKLQILESRTLPEYYETNLFSLGQPIVLRTGQEIQATKTVGRNLKLNLAIELPEQAIRLLVREACLRVPYSGWREHAELLSNRSAELWTGFSTSETNEYRPVRRAVPTELYEFNINLQYNQKDGEPPELTIYNLTNGYQTIYDEILKDLRTKHGMFASDVRLDLQNAAETAEWFRKKIANERNHISILDKLNTRWPIAVHVRLANSSRDWSTIIGERSIEAPDRSALTSAVTTMCQRILASKGDPLTSDIAVVPTSEMERPMLHSGVQFLTSRKTIEGMDHVEIRFRFRSAMDGAEAN